MALFQVPSRSEWERSMPSPGSRGNQRHYLRPRTHKITVHCLDKRMFESSANIFPRKIVLCLLVSYQMAGRDQCGSLVVFSWCLLSEHVVYLFVLDMLISSEWIYSSVCGDATG